MYFLSYGFIIKTFTTTTITWRAPFFIADNKQMVHFAMYLNISFPGHRFHFLRDSIEPLVFSICFIVFFS